MPASDDRFARQNRCGPPPGFPLASPCAGIVHRLSGPNGRAPARVPRRASGPAGGAPLSRVPTCVRLRCASGLLARPYTRGDVRLLGPCFKTGRRRPSSQRPGRRGAGVAAAARSSARGARAAESGVCKSPPAAGGPRSPGPPARARAGAGPGGAGCGVRPPRRGPPRRPAPPEFGSRALPPRQFHVLFDPLSRVLFIFRSLYLCAIGLRPVFSLGRNLPPALGSTPKLPDSSRDAPPGGGPGPRRAAARGSHPLRRPVPGDSAGAPRGARRAGGGRLPLQAATRAPPPRGGGAGRQIWAVAASLAATGAIPVGFFSSAY